MGYSCPWPLGIEWACDVVDKSRCIDFFSGNCFGIISVGLTSIGSHDQIITGLFHIFLLFLFGTSPKKLLTFFGNSTESLILNFFYLNNMIFYLPSYHKMWLDSTKVILQWMSSGIY
jgi:hypothetical protein